MKATKYVLAVALGLAALGASPARADSITYTFTGAGTFDGTDFTIVSPSGFLSFPVGCCTQFFTPTTATDLMELGNDEGPITSVLFAELSSNADVLGFNTAHLGVDKSTQLYSLNTLGSQNIIALTLDGNIGTLDIITTPVPEPSSLLLLGTGLLGLAGAMRRKWPA